MDRLFGVPTEQLAFLAAATLAAVLLAMVAMAWRRPVLLRLGLRAVPRRPLRTALIVLGLTASTAVITTAIGTGETMAGTIRAAVAGGIGPVDEVIIAGSRGTATPSLRDPRAVLAGADLAAGEYFPEQRWESLANRFRDDPDIAALEPSAQTQATAVNPLSGKAHTGVNLLGLRATAAVFSSFSDIDGHAVSLADLQPSEVFVNAEAARLLELSPDQDIILRLAEDRSIGWRVRAVVRDGGLAGIQPAVLAPLDAVQLAVGKPGQINQILVANRTGAARAAFRAPRSTLGPAARSKAVTGRLRLAIADEALMEQAARALATETGQSQLRALEQRVRPEARPAIARLREVSRSGKPTPELAYYLADPLLTSQYRWVLNIVAGMPSLRGRDLADRLAPATVLEVKERAIAAANEYGSAVTTVFLILGLFSIAASLLLVFLIFVMLAAERRMEMGMLRALGTQRHHLIAAFAVEGLVYDLGASAIGLGLGIGVGAVVLRLLQNVLKRFDVTVHGQISPGGMVLSFCLGALVTFATVLLASWKVSRVNIVAAIYSIPDDETRVRRRARRGMLAFAGRVSAAALRAALGWGLLPAGAGLVLVTRAHTRGAQLATGGSLLVLAAALAARAALIALGARRSLVDRLIATTAGPVIALFFALSPSPPPTVRTDAVLRTGTAGFVLAGVAMAMAMVWAAGQNLDLLLMPVRVLAGPFGSLAPATKMAVAYPLTHPFRTALTAAMFALVFLVMVSATTLLGSTEAAYVKRDGGAGFDIRAQFSTPPEDLGEALSRSTTVRPEDFTAIGGQAMSPVEALWPAERPALWRPVEVRVADEALLAASSGQLLARATGLKSDEAVWRAVRDRPGAALVSRRDLSSLPTIQAALDASAGGVARFDPAPVWVRDPRGGAARKLTVIGVTADGAILPTGLLTSQASLAGSPAASQPPAEFFLRTREDVSYRSAATGLQLTFAEGDVRTRILGDEARTGHAVRGLLDTLVRGFLGMGLFSGIAALGVIGMRSVAERRQQIGMLRAIGFSRRAVQATFLIEGSVVAILGITVGGATGLILAKNVVAFLGRDFPQLTLIIPWPHVAAIAGAAYAAALLSALLVAWQSGRITPAEALRYE
jgi:putative ABC transport system permease protein